MAVKKLFDPNISHELLAEFDNEVQKLEMLRPAEICLVVGNPRDRTWLLSPGKKWTKSTDPIYKQGYDMLNNPLTKWDEPPSGGFH